MRAKISVITPDAVEYLPKEIVSYLDNGLKGSPTSDLTIEDVIANAKAGVGDIISIYFDGKISGAAYFMYGNGILDVVTLGGDEFKEWKKDIHDFAVNMAKSKNCKEIWLITRPGWKKIFPLLKEIGVVYSLRV